MSLQGEGAKHPPLTYEKNPTDAFNAFRVFEALSLSMSSTY